MITNNVPWSSYCQIKKMNPSTIVAGIKSMKRLKRAIDGGYIEETNAMRIGTGIHALLLEPQEFERRFVVMPAFQFDADNKTQNGSQSTASTTKYCQAKIAAFEADNADRCVIGQKDYDTCLRAIQAIRSRRVMARTLDISEKEVTIEGEIFGVPFKGRIDYLRNAIGDVKTTTNVEARAFGRTFANLQYDFKLAIYRELVRQNIGDRDVEIIAQETSGDFDNALVPVPAIVLDNAMAKVKFVIEAYKEALATDEWPGVDGGREFYDLYMPQWAMEDADVLDTGPSVLAPMAEQSESYF